MIFPKPIVGKIIRGEVTMTYRPASTRRPRAGERLFVKARQSDPIACHVVVKGSWEGRLGALTFEDVRACGYKTRDGFRDAWLAEHDRAWLARWADLDEDALELAFRVRWDGRWRNARANILTFALDHSEEPRFLMQGSPLTDGGKARLMSNRKLPPGRAKAREVTGPEQHGYTASPARAVPNEPEPVDPRLQDRYSREGHQGFVARERARELDRENLLAEERMRLVRIDARAQGVDIGYLEGQILSRLRAAERKIHNHRAA